MTADPPTVSVAHLPAVGLLEGLARLHEIVLLADAEERILWVSESLASLCGRSRSLIGKSARGLFGSADRHDALLARLEDDGFLANEPIEVIRSDGSLVPVEVSAAPVRSPCGDERFFLAILRPAGGGTRERDALRHAVDYFRAILDSSPEAVLAVDRRGFVTYANAAFQRLLGHSTNELLDRPILLVFAQRAELEAVARALLPEMRRGAAEFELEAPDGTGRLLSISSSPLRLPDGSRAGTVAFLRDVTVKRRFEQELSRKNAELEHYVHTVSHDLRTPLVSLLGFSRLLAQDYGDVLTDTGRHFLERIEQASRNMESLINDLLEFSRIGKGSGPPELIDPLAVLKQLAHELKPRLDAASITLRLPESPPLVRCVRTHLYQVFSNLIGNAIEHMGECAEPWIEVTIDEGRDAHSICVRDGGVGIPQEHHQRVFEIFQTVGRRRGSRKGTGIGLAIVKKIAESHGGRVWLESQPGQGAAFFLALPRI